MKSDEIAEALKDKLYKTVLQDLAITFPPGKKFPFNKPGYVSCLISKFPHISVDQDRLFGFYQAHELVEINGNTIEVKEKALEYV